MTAHPLDRVRRCPAWCTEHRLDIDESFAFHAHRFQTATPGTWVDVIEEPGRATYIDVETAGDGWTPRQALDLIGALVQAIWVTDPDFEHPADTDPCGLWQAVGAVVREHTTAAGLDQITVAMLLGISQPEFSTISRGLGVRTFTLTELATLAEFLGITLADLVSDIDARR